MKQNMIGNGIAIGGLGCFGYMGVMSLLGAFEALFVKPFDPGTVAVQFLVGLLFAGMAFGALYFIFGYGVVSAWRQKRLFARYADAPWQRRKDWREGRILYRKGTPAAFLWVFAVGWNGIVGTVLWANRAQFVQAWATQRSTVFFGGVFVLIGLLVLYNAVRFTFARPMADRAEFVMDPVPAWTGETLKGVIQTRIPLALKKPVALKLACTSGKPLEATVPADRLVSGEEGIAVPVEFAIPADSEPTDEFNTDSAIAWTLEARMPLPNQDFNASFEVPVYKK